MPNFSLRAININPRPDHPHHHGHHGHPDANDVKLEALKKEISEATASLQRKKIGITVGGAVLGGAAGMFLLGDPSMGLNLSGAIIGGSAGVLGAGMASDYILAKDRKELELKEQIFTAETSGPEARNWGHYYAREAGGGQVPNPPPAMAMRNRQAAPAPRRA